MLLASILICALLVDWKVVGYQAEVQYCTIFIAKLLLTCWTLIWIGAQLPIDIFIGYGQILTVLYTILFISIDTGRHLYPILRVLYCSVELW